MAIRGVVFDVGETLIDETRTWTAWADWYGVPTFTFFGVLGGLIAKGEDHRKIYEIMRPGSTARRERELQAIAGRNYEIGGGDLYPDVLPCLIALRNAGYRLGIAGNQPESAEAALNMMNLNVDMVAASARWGFNKPAPEFFDRVVEEMGLPAGEIVYVGDRVDNDVVPAANAGMISVFIKRGPWGYLQADHPDVARARYRIDALGELPSALSHLNDPSLSNQLEGAKL